MENWRRSGTWAGLMLKATSPHIPKSNSNQTITYPLFGFAHFLSIWNTSSFRTVFFWGSCNEASSCGFICKTRPRNSVLQSIKSISVNDKIYWQLNCAMYSIECIISRRKQYSGLYPRTSIWILGRNVSINPIHHRPTSSIQRI